LSAKAVTCDCKQTCAICGCGWGPCCDVTDPCTLSPYADTKVPMAAMGHMFATNGSTMCLKLVSVGGAIALKTSCSVREEERCLSGMHGRLRRWPALLAISGACGAFFFSAWYAMVVCQSNAGRVSAPRNPGRG